MSGNRPYMPLYTDMTDRKILVIGHGEKAEQILRYLEPFTSHLYLLKGAYERKDLYGMDYVICQEEDETIREDVFAACRTLGIRVCIPGSPRRCDFFLHDRPES